MYERASNAVGISGTGFGSEARPARSSPVLSAGQALQAANSVNPEWTRSERSRGEETRIGGAERGFGQALATEQSRQTREFLGRILWSRRIPSGRRRSSNCGASAIGPSRSTSWPTRSTTCPSRYTAGGPGRFADCGRFLLATGSDSRRAAQTMLPCGMPSTRMPLEPRPADRFDQGCGQRQAVNADAIPHDSCLRQYVRDPRSRARPRPPA